MLRLVPQSISPTANSSASVERVREALRAGGHADTVRAFPEGTRSAAEAAAAIGCDVAEIAKSVVLRDAGGRAVIVVASGANRVDARKVAALVGLQVKRADVEFVRAATGFAIGGVSPLGLAGGATLLFDEDLLRFATIWPAAGSPNHVFSTTPAELLRLTGARTADIKEDSPP